MKKLLLMGVIATAAISTASAQASFGPRVGVNFANVSNAEGSKSKTGFLIGVAANFGMNDLISIQPELLYTQAGNKMDISMPFIGDIKQTTTFNYIQVPVLVKATFGDGDLKFHANVGPYLGYMMSGKVKGEAMGEEFEEDIKFEKDEETGMEPNRMDVGLLAGVGVGLPVGSGNISIDLRYGLGMSDLNKFDGDKPDGYEKNSNRVLGLSVAYMFGGE